MASAYSILKQYGEYISPYDFKLMAQVGTYKQQKYDVNDAKIDSEISRLTNLNLVRGVDKEYLHNRVSALVQETNAYGGMDLSSNGLTKNITNHISQAIDDNVMEAIKSSQNVMKYYEEENFYRTKKPEMYSDLNTAYSRQGLNEYLNNTEVGASFDGANYVPFVDIKANYQKFANELYKNSEQETEVPVLNANGERTGEVVKKKVKGLTEAELNSVYQMSLDANSRKQLDVNAWGNREGIAREIAYSMGIEDHSSPEVQEEMSKRFDEEVLKYTNAKIETLENAKKVLKNQGKIDDVLRVDEAIKQYKDQAVSMAGNPLQSSVFLENVRNQEAMSSIYGQKVTQIKYDKDDFFWKVKDYELQLDNYKLRLAEFQDRVANRGAKSTATTAKAKTATGGSLGGNTDDLVEFTVGGSTFMKEEANPFDTFVKDSQSNRDLVNGLVDKLYQNVASKDPKVIAELDKRTEEIAKTTGVSTQLAKQNAIKEFLESGAIKKDSSMSTLIPQFNEAIAQQNVFAQKMQERDTAITAGYKDTYMKKALEVLHEDYNDGIRDNYLKTFVDGAKDMGIDINKYTYIDKNGQRKINDKGLKVGFALEKMNELKSKAHNGGLSQSEDREFKSLALILKDEMGISFGYDIDRISESAVVNSTAGSFLQKINRDVYSLKNAQANNILNKFGELRRNRSTAGLLAGLDAIALEDDDLRNLGDRYNEDIVRSVDNELFSTYSNVGSTIINFNSRLNEKGEIKHSEAKFHAQNAVNNFVASHPESVTYYDIDNNVLQGAKLEKAKKELAKQDKDRNMAISFERNPEGGSVAVISYPDTGTRIALPASDFLPKLNQATGWNFDMDSLNRQGLKMYTNVDVTTSLSGLAKSDEDSLNEIYESFNYYNDIGKKLVDEQTTVADLIKQGKSGMISKIFQNYNLEPNTPLGYNVLTFLGNANKLGDANFNVFTASERDTELNLALKDAKGKLIGHIITDASANNMGARDEYAKQIRELSGYHPNVALYMYLNAVLSSSDPTSLLTYINTQMGNLLPQQFAHLVQPKQQ